ncbi:MAG TPA: HEAT repeat domain-containing protein [Thermomicrobiales bacterium]|nr:HEAT repeat domain-containing protein [Thermomicrobiales bacterium]
MLTELTSSPDWQYRRSAAEALGYHRFGRQATSTLSRLLGDPSPYVVRTACDAVARLALHDAHDAVAALLRSSEAATRLRAVEALVALWQPDDFAPAFAAYRADSSEEMRRQAAWTLRATASEDTWQRLFEAWHRDPLPRHRVWAVELAAAFGDNEVKAQVQALTTDRDGHVRKAAQRSLQQLEKANRGHDTETAPSFGY